MKKRVFYFIAFLCLYLVFVVALMPATFVLQQITLPKNISIQGVTGTIWQTKIEQLTYDTVTISNVNAKVNLGSLFYLNPQIDISFGDTSTAADDLPNGTLHLSNLFDKVTLSDATILTSANYIAQQLPLPIPLQAAGQVKITIEQFTLGQGKALCTQINGQIFWPNAAIDALNESVFIDDLQAELGCEQGAITVVVDPKNNLGLSFSTHIKPNNISGKGYLLPKNNFPKQLTELLPFLGKPDRQGRYRLFF